MRKFKTTLLFNETTHLDANTWLKHVLPNYPVSTYPLLQHAYVLAEDAGADRATPVGLSCLHQGLIMTEILAELNLDAEALAATLCYPSVHYAELTIEDITEQLGPTIAELVRGTQRMESMHNFHEQIQLRHRPLSGENIDNLRKMLLAIVSDVRIVLIKLAEKACLLKSCKLLGQETCRHIASEVMEIYAPLANRLGIGRFKWELEDLAFRYLDPESYKAISHSLKSRRDDRELYVQKIIDELKRILEHGEIKNISIHGRVKHIYSIYRKMQRKKVDINEIYDATAVRILVPSIADCYTALSYVHSHFQHITKEFDDYIANPKSNGYRSIHTAIIGPDNKHVEIQIRTYKIHEEVELGVAAHWKYKEDGKITLDYEQKIAWLRQVLAWQQEVTDNQTNKKYRYHEIFDDRIYVFTPHGDIVDLAKGSTPLDFAYHIHTDIGHRCRGAKVNNKLVNLTHLLETGDRIEIITGKHDKPSLDWLNPHLGYLHTSRAKAKVHHWFRKQEFDANLATGYELFDKEVKRLGLKNIDQTQLAKALNYSNANEMLAALGRGDIRVSNLVNAIQTNKELKPSVPLLPSPPTSWLRKSNQPTDIQVYGVGNLLTHIAQCCKPIPGEEIIGYMTLSNGVSIHRKDCTNLLLNQENDSDRFLEVSWGEHQRKKYPVDIKVDAYDRPGLVRDITHLIVQEHISIIKLTCTTNASDHTAQLELTIEIDSLNPLSRILNRIQQLPNIITVKRLH